MFTLAQLAKLVECPYQGDPGLRLTGVNPFESAGNGEVTLASSRRFLSDLQQTGASAVIVPPGAVGEGKALIFSAEPKVTFARAINHFHPSVFEAAGISRLASIGRNCRIDAEVTIHPFVTVGNDVTIGARTEILPGVFIGDRCRIGSGSRLHSNVTIYPGVSLGERVVIHGGSVIGADGFGYVHDGTRHVKVPQVGTVEIHDDVEIGANSCVDRGTFGATVIERGVKLDNLVHIAHNCRIGEQTIIVGCVGVSGSVQIGRNCVIAGQAGVSDHVTIGDNVQVMQKTAVTKDVSSGARIAGPHGRDYRRELKIEALLQRLPEIFRDLKAIKREIEKAEDQGP